MKRKKPPIRVFWSELSQRFYASAHYRNVRPGVVEITGEKFDVTQDIAEAVVTRDIKFEQKPEEYSESAETGFPL